MASTTQRTRKSGGDHVVLPVEATEIEATDDSFWSRRRKTRRKTLTDQQKQDLTDKIYAERSEKLRNETDRQALELRKAGSSYYAIAQALNLTGGNQAKRAVQRALSHTERETTHELWQIQLERLNHMLLVLWPKIQGGDARAITTGLSVMSEINRLNGIENNQVDVTVRHEGAVPQAQVLIIGGNKDEYIKALAQMTGTTPIDTTSTDTHTLPIHSTHTVDAQSYTTHTTHTDTDTVSAQPHNPPESLNSLDDLTQYTQRLADVNTHTVYEPDSTDE